MIPQENELAKVDKMQNETIEKLQKEIEAEKQSLELSRVQCEARESEILAAQAQNSILQETIKELNDIVIELRARVDREETDASSGRVLAQRELHLEQSKAQLLEQQLQVPQWTPFYPERLLETRMSYKNERQTERRLMAAQALQCLIFA